MSDILINKDQLKKLRAALDAYDAAASKFIGKVERGEARSRVTYAELKAARDLSTAAQEEVDRG